MNFIKPGFRRLNQDQILLFFFIAACITLIIVLRSFTLFNNNFHPDALEHFLASKNLIASHTLPDMGPSLTGIPARLPGGGYYSLLYIAGLLFNTPFGYGLFLAVLMLISTLLFISVITRIFGLKTGVLTAALIYLSPTMAAIESQIWNPFYMVAFSFLLAFIVLKIFSGRERPVYLLSLMPLIILMAQCHLTVIFYLPAVFIVYFVFFYKGKNRLYFWLGFLPAVLLYLPYLLTEFHNGFANTRLILSSGQIGGSNFKFPILTFILIFPTINLICVTSGEGSHVARFIASVPLLEGIFYTIVMVLSVLLSAASFIFSLIKLPRIIRKMVSRDPAQNDLISVRDKILFFYFLLFIGLLFSFLIFQIPPTAPHYYYGVYAFAYFPVIYAMKEWLEGRHNEKSRKIRFKWLTAVVFFLVLGGFGITYRYFMEEYRYTGSIRQIQYVRKIAEDSQGKPFVFHSNFSDPWFYSRIAREYLKIQWNETAHSGLQYALYDSRRKRDEAQAIAEKGERIFGDKNVGLYRSRR